MFNNFKSTNNFKIGNNNKNNYKNILSNFFFSFSYDYPCLRHTSKAKFMKVIYFSLKNVI